MNGYFKPLRRKIGVVMLLLAGVIVVGWVKSQQAQDTFTMSTHGQCYIQSVSWNGNLIVMLAEVKRSDKPYVLPFWESRPIDSKGWYFKAGGNPVHQDPTLIPLGMKSYDIGGQRILVSITGCRLQYWQVAIPLTLLSAYLLLSKPRAGKDPGPTQI